MAQPPTPTPGTAPPVKAEDRLDSWKEIAAYLNRDVTTVQRWEKREGMPVHRHLHDKVGSVYASRAELDEWTRRRSRAPEDETGAPVPPSPSAQPSGVPSGRSRVFLVLVAIAVLVTGVVIWLNRTEYFWRNPIANARFQRVTDFDGLAQAAAVSRDGHLIAFLSDRDGQMDVWLTQAGSGEFHNLTRGSIPGLVNPLIRSLAFTPDGSLITLWVRKQGASNNDISMWAVPILGGEPRPYLEGVAELDWSHDGSRFAYHTSDPGDPLFVSRGMPASQIHPVFTAASGIHSHFPVWSPDDAYIYLVHGAIPDKLDIWRIKPEGGTAERITSHNETVIYPVLLDRRTLLYLATDSDGSGPWLYGMDVERRVPHRLGTGLDRYTSLAASSDGRRLVLSLATSKRTLWRSSVQSPGSEAAKPVPISLATSTGFTPRFGPDYLLYISSTGASESIWKLSATAGQLWNGDGAQIFGGPAISRDGQWIAFSVRQNGKTLLYDMRADGTQAGIVTDSLDLQGSPVWTPDGQAIVTAANDHGVPHLYRVTLTSRSPAPFVAEYSVDPAWAPSGDFLVYSGPDVGTIFSAKAATSDGAPHPLPSLRLTRGARHMTFLPGTQTLVVLRGDIQHKNLWLVDLATGAERQLTNLPPDFDIRDFDISPDGRELIFERAQERSDVVLLDLARH